MTSTVHQAVTRTVIERRSAQPRSELGSLEALPPRRYWRHLRQTGRVSFNQYEPYGPVVETTLRIVTWNVWGRYGNWQERQTGIEECLAEVAPDIVCLAECWSGPDEVQASLIAKQLGLDHSLWVGDWAQEDWVSGIGLVSRWPVTSHERVALRGEGGSGVGEALFALIEGDRGPIQLFIVMLDYLLDASVVRQAQVRQLAAFIQESTKSRYPVILCGDFNAGPDSDEIRMLTGRTLAAAPGLVFYDAWEIAGDGTPGYTWSNRNPLAAVALYPDRRFDYVLSAWPRLGGVGHPTRCELLGVIPSDQVQLSDHYGVLAELRY
jgi:endonuclease/exonuclease/phosphatase family metal-dependent hydrolase